MSKKILISLSIIMLLLITLISAVTYKQNTAIVFAISCDYINCSDGNVLLTVSDPEGLVVVDSQVMTNKTGYVQYNLTTNDTANIGTYSFYLKSDTDYYTSTFNITPNGRDLNVADGIMFLAFVFVLCLFLGLAIYGIFYIDNYISKFTLYWVSHLLLITLSFTLWHASQNFLIGFPFVIGFFRILWWFVFTSVFPMLLLSIAWVIYIHTVTEEMKRLIDGGMSVEEAFTRSKVRGFGR